MRVVSRWGGQHGAHAPGRRAVALGLAALLAVPVAIVAGAAPAGADPTVTFTVDRFDDTTGGACAAAVADDCSLRSAVALANAEESGGAAIQLPAGTYALSLGQLTLTKPMTILGAALPPGAGASVLDAEGRSRVLQVSAPDVTVGGVGLTGGSDRLGGGIVVDAGAGLNLADSSVFGNSADEGAGIHNSGTVRVSGTTVSGNSARRKGGGILNAGAATITNSTIHGNSAQGGGGIASSGAAVISYATITANMSTNRNGGGLYRVGGTFDLRSSIVTENIANSADAHDCSGSPNFNGVNLIGNIAGCNPTGEPPVNGDPELGPLGDNGGPSNTRALGAGSVAIDAEPVCDVSVDQRGVSRPSGATCDLGAYELEPLSVSLVSLQADLGQVEVGAETVPVEALLDAAMSGASAETEGPASTPLGSIPLASIPLGSIPLGSIPLGSIPLGSIPLGSIPLGSIPLASIPLGSILLSDVPLLGDLDWSDVLGFDTPAQTVTLAEAFATLQSSPLGSIPLGSIDLSATPLGSIPLVSILLWDTPLGSIPLGSIGLDAQALCELLGEYCDDSSPDAVLDQTFVDLGLQGAPLGSIPLGSIPLGSIPLGSIPLGSIPLGSIPLGSIPLGSIPLGSIPLGSIGTIIDCTAYAHLCDGSAASTPLGSIPADAFVGTLAELQAALGTSIDLPGNLGELLLALFGGGDPPWEELDLDAVRLQPIAEPPQPLVTYTARYRVGGGAPADVTLTIALPDGFTPQALDAPLDQATNVLTYVLEDQAPGAHTLAVPVWAGMTLGEFTATANVSATDGTATVSDGPATATVDVIEASEGGTAGETEVPVDDGVLNLAHVSTPGDLDFYTFAVGADGTTASIILSNLPADYDLVLYGPRAEPLRGEPTEERSVVPDHLLDLAHGDDPLDPEVTADIPTVLPSGIGAAGLEVHRISARRGTADELIDTGSLRPGSYVVQVSGYNGAADDTPYALRLRLSPPPSFGDCATARNLPTGDPGYGPVDGSLDGVDTLFLVNEQWFTASYSGAGAALDALEAFAARSDLGFTGAVVRVDGDGTVRAAYGRWDDNRCSPAAANDVVRAIGDLLDGLGGGDVENIVLVGDDLQIPFARVPDGTKLSNERSHADEVASGGNNELVSALGAGYVLSDAPYGTPRGIAVDDHELFLPTYAVGRLVETPIEIMETLSRFADAGGRLDPSTLSALVTGYDFLTDGAERISQNISGLGVVPDELINETWSATQLAGALDPAPEVASVNAHFDATRLLPALGNANHDESDLFTTGDYPVDVVQSLLFSMGCHSGLNVPDLLFEVDVPDWAQTLVSQGDHMFGNTGFGYGDTALVALSERLMALFAEGLASGMAAGESTVFARQEYARDLALLSPYDEKILHEATFYGLPMLRIGDPPGEATTFTTSVTAASHTPPAEPEVHTDPVTGLPVADETFDPTLTQVTTPDGSYYHVDGRTLNVQHRPVQPLTSTPVTRHTTEGSLHEARGVLVTGLSSEDELDFDPVYFRPTVDLAANEPQATSADATFPTRIAGVVTSEGSDGPEQHLTIVPGQFRASSDPDVGTQRLYRRVDALVYYAGEGSEADAPTILESEGVIANGFAGFDVTVVPGAGGSVERVYVLFKDVDAEGVTNWTGADLHLDETSGHWVGGAATAATGAEFIVQAVGGDGQVAWSSAKGTNFLAGVTSAPDIQISLSSPSVPQDGWYSSDVTVTITDGDDLEHSVDGGPFVAGGGPFTLSTEGVHVILARSGGSLAAAVVAIDRTAPTVVASTSPAPNTAGWNTSAVTVTLAGSDGGGIGVDEVFYRVGSGAVQTYAAPFTVSPEGTTAVTFWAQDLLGNSSSGSPGSLDLKIDTTNPTVSITKPADGATFIPGSNIGAAQFGCADDNGSGIGSCVATIDGNAYSGAALPSSHGDHTFSVTATDNAGNQTTVAHTYRVAYAICLLYDPDNPSPAGAAYPVKIQLCDGAGDNLSSRSIVLEGKTVDGSLDSGPNFQGNSNTDYFFRYDSKLKGYIYNLDTTGLTAGPHTFEFTVAGAAGYSVPFTLK